MTPPSLLPRPAQTFAIQIARHIALRLVALFTILTGIVRADTMLGLTTNGNLVRFETGATGTITTIGAITGLGNNQTLTDIAYRPATGQLYGLAYNSSLLINTVQLYLVNPATAAATPIGSPIPLSLGILNATGNGNFGFAFDPVQDAAIITANATGLIPSIELKINPTTGAIVGSSLGLGLLDTFPALAATNPFSGAQSTTFYVYNFTTRDIGILNTVTGAITTIGDTGVDPGLGLLNPPKVGLDVGLDNTAWFLCAVGGTTSTLYKLNVATGNASNQLIGVLGATLRDIAAVPPLVNSLVRVGSQNTSAGTVEWTLSFNAAVVGLTANNFTLSGTAIQDAQIGTPTTNDGGKTWTIPVTTGPDSGTLTLKLAGATGLLPGLISALPLLGDSFLIEKLLPGFTSLNRVGPELTNSDTVQYTLSLTGLITGLAATNLGLTGTAAQGAIIGTPTTTDGGKTWTVPITTGPNDGTLTLNVTSVLGLLPGLGGILPLIGDLLTVDKTPPVITGPFSPLIITEGNLPNYISDAVITDAHVGNAPVTQDPPPNTPVTPGIVPVTIETTDAAGNTGFTTLNVVVRPSAPVHTVLRAKSSPAPGAGGPSGLPGDAQLVSFGTPATDELGNVAFVAKWISQSGGRGSGVFTNNACLAISGASATSVTGIATAKYKRFTDPVISDGHVAFIATFSGVPGAQSTAILSDATGTLATVASAGADATPDGATFKAFKSVAIDGAKVGFLAQLKPGTGTSPKTTGASDVGLWIKNAANPLALALRESDEPFTGRVIKSLVSFAPGDGSPGQGRGWFRSTPSGGQFLTRVIFTGASKGILAVDSSPTLLSVSGATGNTEGGPGISGAAFATYGLPALSENGASAFQGSYVGNGPKGKPVTTRGLFFRSGTTGAYTPVARLGESSPLTGTTFQTLQDPVLNDDGALAFPARLKGIKGLPATTLWWQPAGESLTLLAQAGLAQGGAPNDLPSGAQWKKFQSLAIASDRGPIFSATLVPNKGSVLPATSKGVWAMDYTGKLRGLFRTNDNYNTPAGTRTLKSFTLLNATVGSTGTSRSFNATQKVVWLATFKEDKSQAIIVTEVP